MNPTHQYDVQTSKNNDLHLWSITFVGFFGVSLLLFELLSTLGGYTFREALGGNVTLWCLVFGLFFSLWLAFAKK